VDAEAERYWPFAIVCALQLAFLVRLLLRERITLQASISYLSFLGVFLAAAILPAPTARLARLMGFKVPSNFLFCMAIMALALLHLRALITIARLETRTVHLTQDLALLEERFEHLAASRAGAAGADRG
jgi:hypothetical protein